MHNRKVIEKLKLPTTRSQQWVDHTLLPTSTRSDPFTWEKGKRHLTSSSDR